ncbi:NBR1-Ig-like domain-containing protein [Hydrogenophaga electricum]|uniref:HTH cro/C1-type domain-containing protein n=1 Tax=Hydrogenophaga electricum TaxID=1230953 RepID=A0ABQ6C2A0_9BURK|nr:NBR1-Ig-like domain-containing protein [Hydrogenophaga electricum]GLS14473.1 hypothetical protein GCM10007935_19040 [Hydrogenophaga electricum]
MNPTALPPKRPVPNDAPAGREPVSELARRIETRMLALGLSKKALAARAGIARQTLYTILDMGRDGDDRMPRVNTLVALAEALRVHPFWLVDGLFANVVVDAALAQPQQGDRAGLVRDVTYPGGAMVAPGSHFTKVWRVQNLGNTPWRQRKLVCWDEQIEAFLRAGSRRLPIGQRLRPDRTELLVPATPPGGVVELSMGFTAPTETGTVISYWVGTLADGRPCFGEDAGLEVCVHVTTLAETRAFRPQHRPA